MRTFVPISLAVLTAACDAGVDGGQDASIVTDSSGVTIVENSQASWDDGEQWFVESDPTTVVGGSASGLDLFNVPNAERLADGRILITHTGSHEILLADPAGRIVNRVGREGDGPGEFNWLTFATRFGSDLDSILAYDQVARRVSVFTSRGRFVRLMAVPTEALGVSRPEVVDVFPDGTLLARGHVGSYPSGRPYTMVHLLTITSEGEPLTNLGEFPFIGCWTPQNCPYIGWYTPRAPTVASGKDVIHSYPESWEIAWYSMDGELQRIVRREAELLPITQEDVRRYREYVVGGGFVEGDSFDEQLGAQEIPESMPAFSDIVVDELGFTWVDEFEAAWPVSESYSRNDPWFPSDSSSWGVFDRQGRYLGSVELPSRLEVTHVGEDFVLGVYSDEFQMETVRAYRLERN